MAVTSGRALQGSRLLSELPFAVPQNLIRKGMVLDNFYLPIRNANGHPEGAPFQHYGSIQSDEAIRYAGEVVEFVRDQMAESRGSGPSAPRVDQG